MSEIDRITEVPGVQEVLKEASNRIESADPALSPADPESVGSIFSDSLKRLEEIIDGHNKEARHDIKLGDVGPIKDDAEADFFAAREKLTAADNSFRESGEFDVVKILGVLLDYASGYHLYGLLCREGDAVDLVDRWNAANEGNRVNCPQLTTSRLDLARFGAISVAPAVVNLEADSAPKSHHEIYFQGHLSPGNTLRRVVELASYGTFYNQYAVGVGYKRSIADSSWPAWLKKTGPFFEFGFSHVTGDVANMGSHLDQYELRGGWHQPFGAASFHVAGLEAGLHLFLAPEAGFGYGQDWLNFGKGFPLEKEQSAMLVTQAVAGVEFDFKGPTLTLAGGYFYDRSLLTSESLEPFYNRGAVVEVGVGSRLPRKLFGNRPKKQ